MPIVVRRAATRPSPSDRLGRHRRRPAVRLKLHLLVADTRTGAGRRARRRQTAAGRPAVDEPLAAHARPEAAAGRRRGATTPAAASATRLARNGGGPKGAAAGAVADVREVGVLRRPGVFRGLGAFRVSGYVAVAAGGDQHAVHVLFDEESVGISYQK